MKFSFLRCSGKGKNNLTPEQKESAIGLKELIYKKLLTMGRRDYSKNQPTGVYGVRA